MVFGNMQKIKLTICPNFFDRSKRIEQEIDYSEKLSIFTLAKVLIPSSLLAIISVNGKIIRDKDYFLMPGDHVVFLITPGDSDRLFNPFSSGHDPWEAIKNTFAVYNSGGSVLDQALDAARININAIPAVGGLALGVEDWARDNPWVVPIIAAIAGYFGGPFAAAGVMYVANRYIGYGKPGEMPKMPTISGVPGSGGSFGPGGSGGFETSNSYSWNPQTLQQIGAAIPRVYGTFPVKGNIISGHISTVVEGSHPGDQVLDVLLVLCQGPISEITEVEINDQPLTDYGDVVTAEYKYGYLNQDQIKGFGDTYTPYSPPGSPLLECLVNNYYTVPDTNFDALEVTVTFPNGLYYVVAPGTELHYEDITVDINGVPTVFGQRYLGMSTWGGENAELSVRIDLYYKKVTDEAYTLHSMNTITENKTSSFSKVFKIENLEHVGYQIALVRITEDHTDASYQSEVRFTGVNGVTEDDFEYPRMALAGIKALATSQLSGSLNCKFLVKGSYVRVYDGSTWTIQWSDNPAWVAYDILTQPLFNDALTEVLRYDGEDPSRIDTASFKTWADFCDGLDLNGGLGVPDGVGGYEKRFTFNGIFDSATSVWDAVLAICNTTRATIVIKGYKYYAVVDNTASPVQMFTSGNIIADSFKETFLSLENRATEFEVEFLNEENDYKRELVTIIDPDASYTKKVASEQYIGITKVNEAWRIARYKLYNNAYVCRVIEFSAEIDAITCSVGDVIYFSHDLPQWGFSGRLVSATSTSVTLDRTVTFNSGTTYGLRVRLQDDTVVYKTTVGTGGTTSILTVSAFTSTPNEFDIYTFGIDGSEYKPFRVTKVQPNPDLTFTIEAVEYNSTIYNVDTDQPAFPTPNYSSLEVLPPVVNLTCSEIVLKGQDGTLVDNIDVYWDRPSNFGAVAFEVWYKAAGFTDYIYAGTSYGDRFRITNLPLVYGVQPYTIRVSTVNSVGKKLDVLASPSYTIRLLGMTDPPSNVSNFRAAQTGNTIHFSWSHIEDADLLGYEIRQGVNWEQASPVGTRITNNYFDLRPEIDGTYRYWIKAIDTTSHFSSTATQVDITVTNIDPALNIIYDVDEVTKAGGPDGELFNFTVGTGLGFCDTESLIFTQSAGTGSYITNIIDLEKTGTKTIRFIDDIQTGTGDATDLTYPDRTDLTYPDDTDIRLTIDFYKYPAFSCTDATGDLAAGWRSYYGVENISGRYIQFGEWFVIPGTSDNLEICNFRCIVDVPETSYKISNYSITVATGHDVLFSTYGLTFYDIPVIGAIVTGASVMVVPSITNKTTTGFHVQLLDIANEGQTGLVDINIFGY